MADDPRGFATPSSVELINQAFIRARKHFDIFLAEEVLNAVDGKATAVLLFGTETPNNPSYESCMKHRIDLKLMNSFADFLAVTARHLNNDGKRLEFRSADRYVASINTAIQRDLLYAPHVSPLNRESMEAVRNRLKGVFRRRPSCPRFRGGWLMNAAPTLFDYLHSEPEPERARVIANAITGGVGRLYSGGEPPALNPRIGDEEADSFPA
jgi:hypothetical protein